MSTAGYRVFSVVLVVLELTENTITSPRVTLVTHAPSTFPSVSFAGLGAAALVSLRDSVGLREAER